MGLASCNGQNPACIFGPTNCQGGTGGGVGALGNAASPPLGGERIADGAPSLLGLFPSAATATTAPIVISFSESLNPDSLDGAFTIQNSVDVSGFGGLPVITTLDLLADGQLVVLRPLTALDPGATYEVRLSEEAKIVDLTGQLFAGPVGGLLGTVNVLASNPSDPVLVTSFPRNAGLETSTQPEIVVVFDREVLSGSIDDASFDVQVDGADPVFDPDPVALPAGGFLPIPDTRIFTYRSVDDDGQPVSLGDSANVVLTLSAAGSEITTLAGGSLPTTTIDFVTSSLAPPSGATILSTPTDAIGLVNLSAGANAFQLEVQLPDGQPGDVLSAFLFAPLQDDPEGDMVAVLRELTLSGTAPIASAVLGLDELLLTDPVDPSLPIFADGPVAFGLRLTRGTKISTVSVLDVDLIAAGIQDPLLDTTPPSLVELSHPDGLLSFRSDLGGLSVGGSADEQLSAVEVVTALGDNLVDNEGVLEAPVVGSDTTGLFLARPVDFGGAALLDEADLPLSYTLVLVDRAGNRSETPLAGTYTQLGQVGPGALLPEGAISVRVYDADTLEPVAQAAVMTHADLAGFPLVTGSATTTDELGEALTVAADASAAGTILSVSAPGYDNFSFHGLEAARISVPLSLSSPDASLLTGIVQSADPVASGLLPLIDVEVGDTRRLGSLGPTFATGACGINPFSGELVTQCSFGPESVRSNRLGAASVIVGEFGLGELLFSAPIVVQGFELRVPTAEVAVGETADEQAELFGLLSNSLDPTDAPVELPPLFVDSLLTFGVDFDDLVDDPRFTGEPTVSVEALLPGIGAAAPLARGLGFPQGTPGDGVWLARSAAPGTAVGMGALAQSGVFDADLMIRVELEDSAGNRAGQRTRLSRLNYYGSTVFPASVPRLLAPAPGGTTGGDSFDVEFDDSLVNVQGDPATQFGRVGLYRVRIIDSAGRGWTLWRTDEPGGTTAATLGFGPTLGVRVPDVAAGGGTALADGELLISIDSFAWPEFQPDGFLFSDVEREYEAFSFGAANMVTQD